MKTAKILIIDLDHTLINSDMMISSIKWLIKHKPLIVPLIPFWLIKSKAHLKQKLLQYICLDVTKLIFNKAVIDYIKQRKNQGDSIILATASAQYYADEVAKYIGVFDAAFGSDDKFNLSSKNKADFLVKKYGKFNFDYAGDHKRDIPVWQVSKLSIVINANAKLSQHVKEFKTLFINT